MNRPAMSSPEEVNIFEKGAPRDGKPQLLNKRLYFQLQVFSGAGDWNLIREALLEKKWEGVIYKDITSPDRIGVLLFDESPEKFTGGFRDFYRSEVFSGFERIDAMTMFGRTYSSGREEDLEDWLLKKPRKQVLNPDHKWAVWYPLRRKPEFYRLPPADQGRILMEHAVIGMAYGKKELAHDIRLACFGIDRNDNEFLIGIVGRDLFPLSHLVQRMRKPEQTSAYLASLGPFFVGEAVWQSPLLG